MISNENTLLSSILYFNPSSSYQPAADSQPPEKELFRPTFSLFDQIDVLFNKEDVKENGLQDVFILSAESHSQNQEIIKKIQNKISSQRQVVLQVPDHLFKQAKFANWKRDLEMSFDIKELMSHLLKKAEKTSFTSIEFIGKTARYLLGASFCLEMCQKVFGSFISSEAIEKWFQNELIQRQFIHPGSDDDFRHFLKGNQEQIETIMDEVLIFIVSRFKNFEIYASVIQTELIQRKSYYKPLLKKDVLFTKLAFLKEFGLSILPTPIFDKQNQYGVVELKLADKDADFLFVQGPDGLYNRNLSSGDSLCIELLPFIKENEPSFTVKTSPYSIDQYVRDLICGNFSVADRSKVTSDHWLRFISEATCTGKRILEPNLESTLIEKMRQGEISFSHQQKIKHSTTECDKRSYIFHLLKDFIEKHHDQNPYQALILTFNACQSLVLYYPSLTSTDFQYIWSELDKLGYFKLATDKCFFANLKHLIIEKKHSFSQVAAYLQLLTFLFHPTSLIRHNGNQPAFSAAVASPQGTLNLLLPFPDQLNILSHQIETKEWLSLYHSFVTVSDVVYPSPLIPYAKALKLENRSFMTAALEGIKHTNPFIAYLGFHLSLSLQTESPANNDLMIHLMKEIPKLFGTPYLEPIVNGLECLSAGQLLKALTLFKEELKIEPKKQNLPQAWIEALTCSGHPSLIYQAYQYYETRPIYKPLALSFLKVLSQTSPKQAARLLDSLCQKQVISTKETVEALQFLCRLKLNEMEILSISDCLIRQTSQLLKEPIQPEFSAPLISFLTVLIGHQSLLKKGADLLMEATAKAYLKPTIETSSLWLSCLQKLFVELKSDSISFLVYFKMAKEKGFLNSADDSLIDQNLQRFKIQILEQLILNEKALGLELFQELVKEQLEASTKLHFLLIIQSYLKGLIENNQIGKDHLDLLKYTVAHASPVDLRSLLDLFFKKIIDPNFKEHLTPELMTYTDSLLTGTKISPSLKKQDSSWSSYPLSYLKTSLSISFASRHQAIEALFSYLQTANRLHPDQLETADLLLASLVQAQPLFLGF